MTTARSIVNYRNACFMNGSYEVWQRGAGASANIAVAASATAYTADRWYLATGASQSSHVSAQPGMTTSSPLSARVQRDSGQTGTGAMYFAYPLDSDEIVNLRGKVLVFNCLVSTGANWSPVSGTLTVNFYVGTGSVGKRGGTGYTSETLVLTGTLSLATSAPVQPFTVTGNVITPITSTQAEIQFTWTPTGTAGANDWFQVDETQLEAGGVSPYERILSVPQLHLCQAHYEKTFPYGVAPGQNAGVAGCLNVMTPIATSQPSVYWQWQVTKRVTPSITTYNPSAANANWRDITGAADVSVSLDPATALGDRGVLIGSSATVAAIGSVIGIHATADASI